MAIGRDFINQQIHPTYEFKVIETDGLWGRCQARLIGWLVNRGSSRRQIPGIDRTQTVAQVEERAHAYALHLPIDCI